MYPNGRTCYGLDSDQGIEFYNRRDWHSSPDPVFTPDEAEIIAHGHVKWDGCMEFAFVEKQHACGRTDLEERCDVFKNVRRVCMERMPDTTVFGNYEEEL